LGGLFQRPRPRRLAHSRWPNHALGRDRALGQPRPPDPGGLAALGAHGIRTIVDLRNDAKIPPGATIVHVPLDDVDDTAFWEHCWANDLDGSAPYYQPFLDHTPERCAAAVAAIARAAPGGVVFHCGLGRDHSSLVTLLLLALAGVAPDAIAAGWPHQSE
jgi:protein-tyrosine phosphatase